MAYDFTAFKKHLDESKEWLVKELSNVRTGLATPVLLDGVKVDSYGSMTPINQVASVSTEDPKTLRISPWDTSQIQAIEGAITKANLGVSVTVDDKGLRVIFPQLTEETRKQVAKIAKDKLEHSRVSVRHERDKVWNDIQDKEKAGELSEDEKFRGKDEMQKLVDATNNALDELYANKEKEILN